MKYKIDYTHDFKKQHRKLKKQGKNLNKLYTVINKLALGEELEPQYRNHKLLNDNKHTNCYECHVEPDWLLIYQYKDDDLILLLFETGSRSELF